MNVLIQNANFDWSGIEGSQAAYSKDLVTSQEWNAASLHYVRVEPGGEIAMHTHPVETEAHFVVSGEGKGTAGDQTYHLTASDVLLALPGVAHSVHNNGLQDLVLLCIFNPPLA